MRKTSWLSIFFILFCACKDASDKEPFRGKEFEGIVTYRISYDNCPDEEKYGDTLRMWYSKGNVLRVYNNKYPGGLRKEVLLLNGNQYLFQVGDTDTLYVTDLGDDKHTKLIDERHISTETRILGHVCDEIAQEIDLTVKDHVIKYYYNYWYSNDVLPINKANFEKRKFACFDRFIDRSGAFYLKYESKEQFPGRQGLSSHAFTAIDIHEQPVDPTLFAVDTTKLKPFTME